MIEIHPSSLDLAAICPASLIPGPQGVIVEPDIPGGRLGSAVHEALALLCNGQEADYSAIAGRWGADAEELERLCRTGMRVWNEYFVSRFPSPEFEKKMECYPWDDLHPLMGTADVMQITEEEDGKHLRVLDWKSGWLESSHGHQMRGYACLGFFSDPSVQKVTVYIVRLRFGRIETLTFTRKDIGDWIMDVQKNILQRMNVHRPGGKCADCHKQGECREYREWRGHQIAAFVPPSQDLRTVEHLPEVMDKVKHIEGLCESFRDAVKAEILEHGPITLPDGRELAVQESTRDVILAQDGWEILKEAVGEDALLSAVEIKRKVLLDIVGEQAPARGKGKAIKELLQKLEEAGALESRPWGNRVIVRDKEEKADGVGQENPKP